jgi:hypothetical protein
MEEFDEEKLYLYIYYNNDFHDDSLTGLMGFFLLNFFRMKTLLNS